MAEIRKFSPLEILDLPLNERRVFLRLSRKDLANLNQLVSDLNVLEIEVLEAIAKLLEKGLISKTPGNGYEVSPGQVVPHTNLPKKLWPALLASGRLYSEQEIESLRIAIPMLQFTRAKNSEFTDHGPGHALRVKSYATQFSFLLGLNDIEHSLLRLAAIFHDIGNIVSRENHNIISQQVVEDLTAKNVLPFSAREARLVGLLCRWHRRDFDQKRIDSLRNNTVRTGFLTSLLRVSDAMDIDYHRADYDEQYRDIVEYFFPQKVPYWSSIDEVLGVRICCSPKITLEVYTHNDVKENIQIDMLRDDLASTDLDWNIKRVSVLDSPVSEKERAYPEARAKIILSVEPHSLIMAALSKKNLEKAGYGVDIHCIFDAIGSSNWQNNGMLSASDISKYQRILIIGDRLDDSPKEKIKAIKSWLKAGISVSLLVRHEASWAYLPALLAEGAEAILGNDWAYFWGDSISFQDLIWARIASLSTRDSPTAVFIRKPQEEILLNGLLQTVFNIATQISTNSFDDVSSQILTVLDHIAKDNVNSFLSCSTDFNDLLSSITPSYKREGRILVVDELKTFAPLWIYSYLLEKVIEKHGRSFDRGIRFNVPYALVFWKEEAYAEFIAVNHWRDEFAIPVRLLYSNHDGSLVESNECFIQARIPLAQADHVINEFIKACNQEFNHSILPRGEGTD